MSGFENPIYSSSSEKIDERLIDYFDQVESAFSTIDLNVEPGAVFSQIQQVFVSVPTNISVDVVVKDKKTIEVYENGIRYAVDEGDNKYADCIDRFNEIISPQADSTISSKRSLLLRPYWKDGRIKDFLCLKPIDIISTNQYSIVLGGPGTGKSTLLKHLSILLAKQYYNSKNLFKDDAYSEFFYKHRYIPIFVQLRWLFNDNIIRQDSMRNITKKSILSFLFKEKWSEFMSILSDNNVIIFFDGIDEIFIGENVCQIVQRLVDVAKDINPQVKIVFSSREESYLTWRLDGFTSFNLQSMDKPCQKILAQKVLKTYHHADFEEKLKVLMEQLEACKLDEQIVGNPLFLSLIVVIYAVNGQMPDQKSLMLKEGIRFLIKRWQVKISQENRSSTYELEQLYTALKEIAYATINDMTESSNPLIIKKEKIFASLDSLVSNHAIASFIPNENVGESRDMLLKCLIDSVGVIVPSKSTEQFEFSHRHFQEYLVASKLVEMPNLSKQLLNMIKAQKGIHHEIYFMIMEILFDKEDYIAIWGCLQYFAFFENRTADSNQDMYAWITWFCCKVISIRDYSLLKTAVENQYIAMQTLEKINQRANYLIANTNCLSIKKRIDCAMYLGEIVEKINLNNDGSDDTFNNFTQKLGDKRIGIALNKDAMPDIVWCEIGPGSFTMGLSDEETKVILEDNPGADLSREQPCVELDIGKFQISKYPITVAQYMAFVEAGAYTNQKFWDWSSVSSDWFREVGSKKQFKKPNVMNAPIVDISWIEAESFCVWLGKCTNATIRMPFECEWEFVAKLHHNMFCYSDKFDFNMYVSKEINLIRAAPVGVHLNEIENYPCDLTSNVWEWTQTLIPLKSEDLRDYKSLMSKRNVVNLSESIDRDSRMVVRGGSFLNLEFQARNTYRGRDYIWNHITARQGFRVVREID